MTMKTTAQKLTTIATALLDTTATYTEVESAVLKAVSLLSTVRRVSAMDALGALEATLKRKAA